LAALVFLAGARPSRGSLLLLGLGGRVAVLTGGAGLLVGVDGRLAEAIGRRLAQDGAERVEAADSASR
jgi:hypothetical protein